MGVEVEVECVKAELYKGTGLDEINIKFCIDWYIYMDLFDFFCMKLVLSKSKKVTKPKFQKKIFWPKFCQIGPKFAQIRGFWSIIQV